jgi:glycosyltransferase involved in cell wall biosynthesis
MTTGAAAARSIDRREPTVSICIPSYRGAAYLPATIRSVLEQSHTDWDLWIVDDASPDETAEVVARFGDPRIHFIENERNVGPEANWNRCLALARGTYYKLLPQDDLLAPGSLAEQVAVLEEDTAEEIALVFGARLIIDHTDRVLWRRGLRSSARGRIDGRKLVRRCIQAGSNMIGEPGNGLMRRSMTERIGPYSTEHPYMIDLDYWVRALAWGDGYYTGTHGSSFRVSQDSWSVALGRRQRSDFEAFVRKYAAQSDYGITLADRVAGFTTIRINTWGRAAIYRSLFRQRT